MNVLFGIQGTGNGHLSRCYRIAEALKHRSVSVDYLISGRERERLFNVDIFADFRCYRGLSFTARDGRIDVVNTLKQNSLRAFAREVKGLALDRYDLVISDFEPVTAWAAKRQGKRCVGMGRQYAFKDPTLYRGLTAMQRLLINYFAPANEWLGMHWSPLQNCLPPVVREQQEGPPQQRHILVYLPFENCYDVIDALVPHTNFCFSVFHPDIRRTKYFASDHIMGFAASREVFAEQLAVASGVIANAGFETTCEALNRGKHLAVKPVSGQFEQCWNARLLKQQGLATILDTINEHTIRPWLNQLATEPCAVKLDWADVANAIADWIANGAEQTKTELREQLWNGSPGWIRTNDTWINSPPL